MPPTSWGGDPLFNWAKKKKKSRVGSRKIQTDTSNVPGGEKDLTTRKSNPGSRKGSVFYAL